MRATRSSRSLLLLASWLLVLFLVACTTPANTGNQAAPPAETGGTKTNTQTTTPYKEHENL